jgi:hypothetical protein
MLLMTILAISSSLFLLVRAWKSASVAGAVRDMSASVKPTDEASLVEQETSQRPGLEASEAETERTQDPTERMLDPNEVAALHLILHFDTCTHVPTSVELLSAEGRLPASVINESTWSLPWDAVQRQGAVVEIGFGNSVRLNLRECRQRELDISMPPLGSLSVGFGDAEADWTTEWTPELVEGDAHAEIASPIAIAGASASLLLRNGAQQVSSRLGRASLLAPVGSHWMVYVSAPGMEVENQVRHGVEVPGVLEFTGRAQPGLYIVGALPKDTLLLVYDDKDMSTPCMQGRVERADAQTTTMNRRGTALAGNAPHHLECVTLDAQRASVAFKTDARGAAEVVVTGVRFDQPMVIPLDKEHGYRQLYLRTDTLWQPVPSDPLDFHREAGSLVLVDTEAEVIRIVYSQRAWDQGFVVATSGAVASVRPATSSPVSPNWFVGKAALIARTHIPEAASTVAWQLSFAAEGRSGETMWLKIADGRGPRSALESMSFYDMPMLRLKLWTKVLEGDKQGAVEEVESPFH